MPATAKVLIVDDDAAGRAMLALSLRQAGRDVVTAGGGEEALRILETQDVACLVTDAKMGPMDGFALAVKAKALHPSLRIAMISAVHHERDAGACPIDYFLPKPVQLDELLKWLSLASGQGKLQ